MGGIVDRTRGLARRVALGAATAAGALAVAARTTPWPSALVIRAVFDRGAARASAALEKHVPGDLVEVIDEAYDVTSPDGRLDVFRPVREEPLSTVVWVHGGAFVSGSKGDVANYLRVLAGRGLATVGVDYSIAPGARYPEPVRQVAAALAHLVDHADRLGVDTAAHRSRRRLGGRPDRGPGGTARHRPGLCARGRDRRRAALLVAPRSRALLRCLRLHARAGVDEVGQLAHRHRHLVLPRVEQAPRRADHPAGLGAGARHVVVPADLRLGRQRRPAAPAHASRSSKRSTRHGVDRETLLFPEDHEPRLGHEYQFDLDTPDGREALDRAVAFIHRVAR